MNRFFPQKRLFSLAGPFFSLAVFVCVLLLFLKVLGYTGEASLAEQQASLERALRNGCVHCYASEGFYPESLDDLIEHYGITYDTEQFLIHYEINGSNVMPNIKVIAKRGGSRP